MGNPKNADYRIERYNGKFRIEVLDKPVGHWYVVRSSINTLQDAANYCETEFEPYDATNTKTP